MNNFSEINRVFNGMHIAECKGENTVVRNFVKRFEVVPILETIALKGMSDLFMNFRQNIKCSTIEKMKEDVRVWWNLRGVQRFNS